MTNLSIRTRATRSGIAGLAILLVLGALPDAAPAQGRTPRTAPRVRAGTVRVPIDRWNRYWGYYSPADAVASRIYAQAEFVRAHSQAAVNYQAAREIRAQAVRQEIDNWVDRLEAYYERKRIGEQWREEHRYRHLQSQKKRNKRLWDRFKNHPELSGPAIANGRALNFLLHRLSGTVLTHSLSLGNTSHSTAGRMLLPEHVVGKLNLRQQLPGGEQLVFRADEGAPLDVDWWPYALRGDEFTGLRDEFLEERKQVVREASGDGDISHDSLESLSEAFVNLSDRFHERFDRHRRFRNGTQSWYAYNRGDVFLRSLYREIRRLKSTGKIEILAGDRLFDPEQDTRDLVALLTAMSRHGLDFAPAKPGDEDAYHYVFRMMRDLYVNVAHVDQSIKPEESSDAPDES